MNLPPDKLQLLSQYDNEKKWELVCDQVRAFICFLWVTYAIKMDTILAALAPLGAELI